KLAVAVDFGAGNGDAWLRRQPCRRGTMQSGKGVCTVAGALMALLLGYPDAYAAEKTSSKSKPRATVVNGKRVDDKKPGSVQLVTFPDTDWTPVKVIRGGMPAIASVPPTERPAAAEIVTFGDPKVKSVRVLRGDGEHPPPAAGQPPQATGMRSELVS